MKLFNRPKNNQGYQEAPYLQPQSQPIRCTCGQGDSLNVTHYLSCDIWKWLLNH